MNCWEKIRQHLRAKLSSAAYDNWLSKTDFHRLDGSTLYVAVPDDITRQWMMQEYAGEVWSAIRDLELPLKEVFYELASSHQAPPPETAAEPVFSPYINLNPRFTFDSFVVGSCNQFAHAAAKAVATIPSKKYNPPIRTLRSAKRYWRCRSSV